CVYIRRSLWSTFFPYTTLFRSMGHQFLAYAEMFDRDRRRFQQVRSNANVCPLGSGAIAGTTVPIDRAFVANYLGFVDEKGEPQIDRKSTRLNSSHVKISYAVFC